MIYYLCLKLLSFYYYILITVLFLAGCAKSLIPMPNTLMPEVNRDVISAESYGPYPKNYQKILKDYLQKNLLNHEDAKVDFINTPKPLSISQVGGDYTGHRVCLSINSKNSWSGGRSSSLGPSTLLIQPKLRIYGIY